MTTTQERMSALVDRIESNLEYHEGCWIWAGDLRMSFRQGKTVKKISVPQALYERHVGPIPKGMQPRSQCLNKACVSPEHYVLIARKGLSEAKTQFLAEAEAQSRKEFRAFLLDVKEARSRRVTK